MRTQGAVQIGGRGAVRSEGHRFASPDPRAATRRAMRARP